MISIIIPTRDSDEKRVAHLGITKASIEKYTTDYEIISCPIGDGMNEKINRGILLSKGDYIVLLHDDVEVTEGWADELADVGAFHVFEKTVGVHCWGGVRGGYCNDPLDSPDYSAFLVISRKALPDIGLTDTFYKEPGWQDNDYGMQIRKAGYQIKCLPGKIIHHALRTAPLSEVNRAYFERKWQ